MRQIILKFLVIAFTGLTAVAAHAEDLCIYMPGTWIGQYTFISRRDCRENHGCTHLISAEVTHLHGTQFQVDLTLKLGPNAIYQFTCENSSITTDAKPNNGIELFCANGACMVKYQDAKVTANVMHVVTKY